MKYFKNSKDFYLKSLKAPEKIVSAILDTDTYNEIDDQFALVYMLLATDRVRMRGITAAPFFNNRSKSPGDGMEKSYREICNLLKLMQCENICPVKLGSNRFMENCNSPVMSPAADFIVEQACEHGRRGETLYIVAIGAITNVASAIVINPEIIHNITVVWLGGHPYYWPQQDEFNLRQDVGAVQVVFDSGVPLVHVPCKNVAEQVRSCPAELEKYAKDRGAIGDYLYESFCAFRKDNFAMTKEIWDMAAAAWLINPECMASEIISAPSLNDKREWDLSDRSRHSIRIISDIRRDTIFKDFFLRLDAYRSRFQD